MRKKNLLFFLLIISLFVFSKAEAQVLIPRYLNLESSNTQTLFNSGDKVDVKVVFENSYSPEDKTFIEYGVARQNKEGDVTHYEPMGSPLVEKVSLQNKPNTQLVKFDIPNTIEINGTSTYVFYAKSYVTNDSDKENFIVSKQNFKIKGNSSTPVTKIKYINLLQSNGQRFGLFHGPVIYDLSQTTHKGVSSSTSIEITFESNVDTKLISNISFKKLRSDVLVAGFNPDEISIKKGLNKAVIPLPVFNYESGVYQGVLKFENVSIPDVNFQYIVAGEMVTFSQPQYFKSNNSQLLNFGVYGTPFDLDLIASSSESDLASEKNIYVTEFVLKDKKDNEVYRVTSDVDFSTSTYSLSIPLNIKDISKVYIKTVNKEGKVIYEGTKELNLPPSASINLNLILLAILFVVLMILAFIFKDKKIKIILLLISIAILFLGVKISTADVWGVPDSLVNYQSFQGGAFYYKNLTIQHKGALIRFNTNIQNEAYDVNEDLEFMYNTSFEVCNNLPTYLRTKLSLWNGSGIIRTGGYGAINSATGNYYGAYYAEIVSYQKHNNTYTSPWYSVNMGKAPADKKVSVLAEHAITGYSNNSRNAYVNYIIPLLNVTDKISTKECRDGKITNIVSIGNQPYVVRTISETPTDEPCSSIPKLNVRVEGITPVQAEVVWEYVDIKPQANYQVELASDSSFSNIIKSVIGNPEIVKSELNLFAKKASAGVDVANVRDVLVSGLSPNTVYFVRIRAHNGSLWSSWIDTSFSTTKDDTVTCPDNTICTNTNVESSSCGISSVSDGNSLDVSSIGLCKGGYSVNGFSTPGNESIIWKWGCKKDGSLEQKTCIAGCAPDTSYCAAKNKCLSGGCSGEDICLGIDGIQTTDDPIYILGGCSKPTLTMSLKFTGKPYADDKTSKCSVDWSHDSNSDDITCKLDGINVKNTESNYKVNVGKHTLSCVAKITGMGEKPIVLESSPSNVNFKCSRVPDSTEN